MVLEGECLRGGAPLGYAGGMKSTSAQLAIAVTPSSMTRHAEMLRLCARIGYSPPRG